MTDFWKILENIVNFNYLRYLCNQNRRACASLIFLGVLAISGITYHEFANQAPDNNTVSASNNGSLNFGPLGASAQNDNGIHSFQQKLENDGGGDGAITSPAPKQANITGMTMVYENKTKEPWNWQPRWWNMTQLGHHSDIGSVFGVPNTAIPELKTVTHPQSQPELKPPVTKPVSQADIRALMSFDPAQSVRDGKIGMIANGEKPDSVNLDIIKPQVKVLGGAKKPAYKIGENSKMTTKALSGGERKAFQIP